MSINLGNEGCAAIKDLRGSAAFAALRDALHKIVVAKMNVALDCEPQFRADQTGYARGLRDLWTALEAEALDQKYNQVKKPGGAVAPVTEKSSAAR